MTWIILAILAALIVYFISLYNGLVKKRQMVEEGWSGIDVQLKRRADLVPNLIETVKGYASHEKETLDQVTQMRTKVGSAGTANPGERAVAEGEFGQALGRLLMVAENYPDLKADSNFRSLHDSLDQIEDALQKSRRYYNGAVRMMNVAVESFPSNLVAGQFGFSKSEYFEIEDARERSVPKVSF